MYHTESVVGQPLSADQKSPLRLVRTLLAFFEILPKTVLPVERSVSAEPVPHLLPQIGVCQPKVLVGQLPQKRYAPHPVCQHMEHFQIDALSIVSDPEEIAVVLALMNQAAGICALLPDTRRLLPVFLEIIPENTAAQTQVKSRYLRRYHIQRFLQKLRLDLFREYHADAVGVRHLLSRDYREKIGRIVQFIPFDITIRHFLFPSIITLSGNYNKKTGPWQNSGPVFIKSL